MAVDLRVELGCQELALEHVAFELRHVDAVGRETAERLVERGWKIAHPEHEARHGRAVARGGPARSFGQDDEAGGVVRLVLHVLGEDLEAVYLSREARGERGSGRVLEFGD